MAAESSSNLTTLSPSLRSSYADIAFGRQSPCPPGGAEAFVDGPQERESPPLSPPPPPQTPPICEKASIIVTSQELQQRPVNVPEQSQPQNHPEPPPRRYPRPSEKKSSFTKSLESGRPASASPHTASRPRRPPRLGHPHLKDSGRTESLDTQSEQLNVQRPHSALPPDTKSLTYDLRTESPSGGGLLEGGKSPSYAQVFFQSNASLCSDQDSDHGDLEELPLDGVAIAESGAGLPPPPIDWDAWDALPSPLRKEGVDPEADILYRHPTIPGLILKRDTSPRPPSRSSRRHRGAGKNKDVGGDRGEEENDEFSLPEKVEVQIGDAHTPPQPPKRKQKKVGVAAAIADDKKKVDLDSSLSEAGKTKKSKASEKACSVKVEDKVASSPSVPQESLKQTEPAPLDIDDVSMSSVSEACRGSKKKKKDKKAKQAEELSLKDATPQPLPTPMKLEDDNDSSSAAAISEGATGKSKKKKNKVKKPQEEDELEKALKEIAREEELRQKRGAVASLLPAPPPQPKSLALDMETDFFSESVSKPKTSKSKKAKQQEQPQPPKTEEKKESVVKVEKVEKLPDSSVSVEVSTTPSKVDDEVGGDTSEASKSKPQPKKKKKTNAKDGKGEDEVEKALREIQKEELKHKKHPPPTDKAEKKQKGKSPSQDSSRVDFPTGSPKEEGILLTENVTEKASATINDSVPPPEKDTLTKSKSVVPEPLPPSPPPKASKRKSKKSESSAAEVPQAAPTKVDDKPVIVTPSEELPKSLESGERQRTISLQAGDDWMAILDDDPSCMNWDDDEEETPSVPTVPEQVNVTPETKPPPPMTTTIPKTPSKPQAETTTKSPPKDTPRQKSGKRKSKKSESESETKSVSSPKNDTTEQQEVRISTPLPAADVPLAISPDKTVKGKSKKLDPPSKNAVTEKPTADEAPLPKPSPVVAEVQPTAAPAVPLPSNEVKPAALSLHGGDDWMSLLDDDSPMIWDDDEDETKAATPISTATITAELSKTSTKPTDELATPVKSIPLENPEVTKPLTPPALAPAAGISLVGGDDWMSILDNDSPLVWDDEDGDDEGKSTVTVEHVPEVSQYLLDTYSTLEKPVQEKVVSPLFSAERMAQQQGKKKTPLPEEYQVFDDPAQAKTKKSEPVKPSPEGKEKKVTGKQQQARRKNNRKSESDDAKVEVPVSKMETTTPTTTTESGANDQGNSKSKKGKRKSNKSESEEASIPTVDAMLSPIKPKIKGTVSISQVETSVVLEIATPSATPTVPMDKTDKSKPESDKNVVSAEGPSVLLPPAPTKPEKDMGKKKTDEDAATTAVEALITAVDPAPISPGPQRSGSKKGKRQTKKSESEEIKVLNEPPKAPSSEIPLPKEAAKLDNVKVEPTLEIVPSPVATSNSRALEATPAPITPNRPGSQKKRNKKKSESEEVKVVDEPQVPSPLVPQEPVKADVVEVDSALETVPPPVATPNSEIVPQAQAAFEAASAPITPNRSGSQKRRNKKRSESEEVKVLNEPKVALKEIPLQETAKDDVVEIVLALEAAPVTTPDSGILPVASVGLEAAPITPNRGGSQKKRNKKKSESEEIKLPDEAPVALSPPLVAKETAKVDAVEVESALEIVPAPVAPDSEIGLQTPAQAAFEATSAPIAPNRPGSQKKRNKKKSESEEIKVPEAPAAVKEIPPLVAQEIATPDEVVPALATAGVTTPNSESLSSKAIPDPVIENRPGSQTKGRRNKKKSESEEVKVVDEHSVLPSPPLAPQESPKVDVVDVESIVKTAAATTPDSEILPVASVALEAAQISPNRPGSQKKRNKKKSESEEVKVVDEPQVPSPPPVPQEPVKVDVVVVESAVKTVPASVATPEPEILPPPAQAALEASPAPITPNRQGSQKRRNKKKSESEESQIPAEKPAQQIEPNSVVELDSPPVVIISERPPKVDQTNLSSNRPVSKQGKRPNQKSESEEVSELPIGQEVKVEATKGKRRGAGRKSSEPEPPTVKAIQSPTEALPAPGNKDKQSLLGELGPEAVVSTTTTTTQSSTTQLPLSTNRTVEQTPGVAAATLPTPKSPPPDDSDVDLTSVGPSDEFMASQQLLNLQLKHQQQQDEQRTAVVDDSQPHKSGSPKTGRSAKTGKLMKKASEEDSSSEEKRVRFKETPEVVKYSPTNSNVTPISVAPAIALSPSADGDIDTASDENSSSAPSSHSGGMKHKKKKKRSVTSKTSGGLAQSPLMWDSDPPPRSPSPLPPFERGDDEFTLVKSKKKNKPPNSNKEEEVGDNDVPPLEPIVVGKDAAEIRDTNSEKKEETIVVVVAEKETKAALFVDDNLLPPLVPPPLLETEVDGRSDSTGDSWTNILDEEEPKLTLAVEDMESLLNLEVEQVVRHDSPPPTGSDIKKKAKTILQPTRTSKNKEPTKKELHKEPEEKAVSRAGEEGALFTTAFLSAIHSENVDTPTNYLDCSSAETLWQEYVALKSSKSGKTESKDENTTTPIVLKDQAEDKDKKNKAGAASIKPQTLAEAAKEVTAQMEQLTKSIITPGPTTTNEGGDDGRRDEHDYLSSSLIHLILLYNDYEREFREGSERRRLQAHEEEGKQGKKESGGGGGSGTCPKKPPGSDQQPPSTGGGSSGGGRKGPVTELLCAGLPSLNWADWSTSLSGGDGLVCHSPPTPAMQANLCKIKESALEDVAVLGQAVDAAIATLGTLSSASLTDTVERTWELLGGLKDLEGASRSLGEILASLPSSDEAVAGLVRSLGEVEKRLVIVTEETRRLNESAKVTRSTESKRMMGGRLTFGAGPAIALLHLRRHQATTCNTKGQRS